MKRYIFAAFAVLMILSLFVLSAGASESVSGIVEGLESESASDGVFEGSETVDGTVIETVTNAIESVTDSSPVIGEIDSQAVAELIDGVGSKYEAVLKLAGLFGISIEDAEALVDNIVVFGDEHFEESDMWLAIRADITAHPEKWTIIAILALGFMALMVFLIRSVIKNTLTQTNTKLKLADIDDHEATVIEKLKGLKDENASFKGSLDTVKELIEGEYIELKKENADLKELILTIRELIEGESAAVDSLKANSETSLKVTEESALQILQLLNIAMDRKVPIATKEARKLWYDDAVAKVKAKAGIADTEAGERGE